jgi:CheY-like chemotaxis protein
MVPGLEAVLAELKAIRRSQDRILDLLTSAPHPAGALGGAARPSPASAAVRTQRRKTVLIIDDDLPSRGELVTALQEAEVPVREAGSGNEGLTLIAQERPDVIVIEADLGGDMSSQDTITLIKATMEWIDIPILLYTRHPIADDDEARTSYAADGFVIKAQGAAATLVNRIVAHFRR